MNLHEYQAKKLFAASGIPIPTGYLATNSEEAQQHAKTLGGDAWMVKAQVHAGGRGKAGGIKKVNSVEQLISFTNQLLGQRLVTHQTKGEGQPIHSVLIENTTTIHKELYLSLLIDRSRERVAVIASSAGGMDIEEVAAKTPEKIIRLTINPIVGLQDYQCRQLAFGLALENAQRTQLTKILHGLYRLFLANDLSLVEINPLIINDKGELLAIDGKINLDDNALYRHKDLAELYDASQEDEKENKARQLDLSYVALDGDIACMVNGAGLAMATMDIIKLHGGEPANFLDVGGNTTAERVTEAFKLILSDKKVKVILVNIFGGIVKCDLIAEGIIHAIKQTNTQLPVVVRLEGTRVAEGKALLEHSGLAIIAAGNLKEAAQKAVEMGRG